MQMKYITRLYEIIKDNLPPDGSLLGGKAKSLAALTGLEGIKVPAASVIMTTAYDAFIEANPGLLKLLRQAEGCSEVADRDLLGNIAEGFEQGSLPPVVEKEISAAYHELCEYKGCTNLRISVRSSATAEDLKEAAFAGQYRTFLNISGIDSVVKAVRSVWASVYCKNACNYRHKLGIPDGSVKMAVILQEMIDAEVSGTGFTVDLETGLPAISLNATWGLGEAEVGGHVTSDNWLIEPDTLSLIRRRRGGKEEKIIYDPQTRSSCRLKTSEKEKSSFCLTSCQARTMAGFVRDIGRFYRQRDGVNIIDTEFAVSASGEIYFTQARPETEWAMGKLLLKAVDLENPNLPPVLFNSGITGSPGVTTGVLRVVQTLEEAEYRLKPGDILVVPNTTNLWESVLYRAGGAVTEIGGPGSHTAIVIRGQGKPAIVGAPGAVSNLKPFDNQLITLDATRQMIFAGSRAFEQQISLEETEAIYRGTDRETPEESWASAEKTGQTHTDEDGSRWIGKPNYKASRFMQDIYTDCHQWMAERLGPKVRSRMVNGIHQVNFEDIFNWRLRLRSMTLEQLEAFNNERRKAVSEYIEASAAFDLSPVRYLDWLGKFIRMNAFMGVAYDVHKVTEGLLEAELERLKVPAHFTSAIRSSMVHLTGEMELTRSIRQYGELLSKAAENPCLLEALAACDFSGSFDMLQTKHGSFYKSLREYALSYKITKTTDFTVSSKELLKAAVKKLINDLSTGSKIIISEPEPVEYYPEDEQFNRILRLTLESEKLRQDSHHINVRHKWTVLEKLQPFLEFLVITGEAASVKEVFSHSPEKIFAWLTRYRMHQWLSGFLGYSVHIPELPAAITIKRYRLFTREGFELFYLPPVNVTSSEAVTCNTFWKSPLSYRYWRTDIVRRDPLPGRWVAVETLAKPSLQGQPYENDGFISHLGLKSRYISWETFMHNTRHKTGEYLGIPSRQVRLPLAIEWNFLGNLLRFLKKTGVDMPDWGETATWEWTDSPYGSYHRLLVGKNGAEGLDGLSALGWVFTGDEWYGIFGFRVLLEF